MWKTGWSFLLLMCLVFCSHCRSSQPLTESSSESSSEASSETMQQEVQQQEPSQSEPPLPDRATPEPSIELVPEPLPEPASVQTYVLKQLGSYIGGGHGITVDDKGVIYMSDTYGNLKPGVKAIYQLKPPYTGAPEATSIQTIQPAGLHWYKGHLYVCDIQGGKVIKLDSSFQVKQTWQAFQPWNVDIDSKGELYTVAYSGQVYQLVANQAPVLLFGGLINPFDLAVEEDGSIWVSEQGPSGTQPGGVTLRDRKGKVLRRLTHQWMNPEGIQRGPDGSIWVAETGRGELLRFLPSGERQVVGATLALPVNLSLFSNGDILLGTVGGGVGLPSLYRATPSQ